MKRLICLISLSAIVCLSSFAQPKPVNGDGKPQSAVQTEQVKNATPQNMLHAPILPFRKTKVEWVAYNGYDESNQYVNGSDVVFIGDSIFELWYTDHPDFFDKNNFTARGIGGQTSISILCRFRQDVVRNNPKAVVILAGINDIAQNDGPMKIEYSIDNIIAMCDQAKANGIKVLLCSLTPCDKFYWNEDAVPAPEVIEFNEHLKAFAASDGNVTYVDFHTPMNNGQGGMKDGYSKDGCHPADAGYDVMERVIVKEINKVLGNDTEYFLNSKN